MFSGVEVRLLGELRPWRSRPLTPWSSQVLSRSVKAARCAWAHYPAAAVWLLLRTDANQACLRRNEWKHPQTWIFPVGPVNFKHLKCLALLHLQISGFQTAICPLRPLRGSFFVLTGLMWWSCFSVSEGTGLLIDFYWWCGHFGPPWSCLGNNWSTSCKASQSFTSCPLRKPGIRKSFCLQTSQKIAIRITFW